MDLNFDASTVDPNVAYEPLPAGWYKAVITDSEGKPTKDMTGKRLNLKYQIIDGEHAGRIIFSGLNVENQSKSAQDRALRDLSAIVHAIGLQNSVVRTSQDLHDKPLMIKVKVKPADGQYAASNEVIGYEAVAAKSGGGGATTAPSGGASAPPWKR